jgi:hypothetical protein
MMKNEEQGLARMATMGNSIDSRTASAVAPDSRARRVAELVILSARQGHGEEVFLAPGYAVYEELVDLIAGMVTKHEEVRGDLLAALRLIESGAYANHKLAGDIARAALAKAEGK